MNTSGACRAATAKGAAAVLALGVAVAGCGGSSGGTTTSAVNAAATQTAAAPAANPVASPPISGLARTTGPPAHQISTTVAAFYRAAWENDAQGACALFSPNGITGFMRAAKVSFPGSINAASTCPDAMRIYNASLTASIQELQNGDASVTGATLNAVTVGRIKVRGNAATAIGPLNALPEINPKLIRFVRMSGRWLIDGSYSLSKSDLPQLLKQAARQGAARKHR